MATAKATLGRPVGGGRSAEENREHIIDAAERCFARLGIDATTVSDIADEAGLSRSLVYRHFDSRDEMVLASLERAGTRLLTAAAAAYESAGDLAALVTDLVVEVVWLARNDPVLAAAFGGANRSTASALLVDSDLMLGDPGEFEARLRRHRPDFLAQLRVGLSHAEALDHVRTFGVMLTEAPSRIAGTKRAIRRYVVTFLLPAILQDPPPVPTA